MGEEKREKREGQKKVRQKKDWKRNRKSAEREAQEEEDWPE